MFTSCNSDYTVKPRGFFQIHFPQRSYRLFDQPGYPYSFEYPVYANVLKDSTFFGEATENPWWINIDFPQFEGRIYVSYKEIGKNKFDKLVSDAFAMTVAAPAAPRVPVRTEPRIDFQNACEKPEYNRQARAAEAQGAVTILYTMETTGVINDATVERSSGPTREHKMLDRLALDAVRACKGRPGTLDGKPEKLTARITYVWKIAD